MQQLLPVAVAMAEWAVVAMEAWACRVDMERYMVIMAICKHRLLLMVVLRRMVAVCRLARAILILTLECQYRMVRRLMAEVVWVVLHLMVVVQIHTGK